MCECDGLSERCDDRLDKCLVKRRDCVDIDFMSSWRWVISVRRWSTSGISLAVWITLADGIAASTTVSANSTNCSKVTVSPVEARTMQILLGSP